MSGLNQSHFWCCAWCKIQHFPCLQYDASASIKLRTRDFSLVETPSQLRDMLREISTADTLAVDCEGVHLGAPSGRVCLMQLAVRRSSHPQASTSTSATGKAKGAAAPPRKSPASLSMVGTGGILGITTESAEGPTASARREPIRSQPEIDKQQRSKKQSSGSSSSKSPPLSIYIVDVHQLEVCVEFKTNFHLCYDQLDAPDVVLASQYHSLPPHFSLPSHLPASPSSGGPFTTAWTPRTPRRPT